MEPTLPGSGTWESCRLASLDFRLRGKVNRLFQRRGFGVLRMKVFGIEVLERNKTNCENTIVLPYAAGTPLPFHRRNPERTLGDHTWTSLGLPSFLGEGFWNGYLAALKENEGVG